MMWLSLSLQNSIILAGGLVDPSNLKVIESFPTPRRFSWPDLLFIVPFQLFLLEAAFYFCI
jgi:hypothetical protein